MEIDSDGSGAIDRDEMGALVGNLGKPLGREAPPSQSAVACDCMDQSSRRVSTNDNKHMMIHCICVWSQRTRS